MSVIGPHLLRRALLGTVCLMVISARLRAKCTFQKVSIFKCIIHRAYKIFDVSCNKIIKMFMYGTVHVQANKE